MRYSEVIDSVELRNALKKHGLDVAEPTYGKVFDWLAEKGLYVSVEMSFRFALSDHVGYYFTVYKVDDEQAKMKKVAEGGFASFTLGASLIIKKSLTLL